MVYLATTICVGLNTTGRLLNHSNLRLSKVIEFCLSLRSSIEASITDVSIAVTFLTVLYFKKPCKEDEFFKFRFEFFYWFDYFRFSSSLFCCLLLCRVLKKIKDTPSFKQIKINQ